VDRGELTLDRFVVPDGWLPRAIKGACAPSELRADPWERTKSAIRGSGGKHLGQGRGDRTADTSQRHGTIAALSGELTLDWLIEAVDHGGGGVRRGARAARTSDELDRMAPAIVRRHDREIALGVGLVGQVEDRMAPSVSVPGSRRSAFPLSHADCTRETKARAAK